MRLEFAQGTIRDWKQEDIRDLTEFANNQTIARNMFAGFPHPYTGSDGIAWLESLSKMPIPTHWAIEVEGRAVGGIGINIKKPERPECAEFGYWLGEPYWGRGIATAATRALVPHVMRQFDLIRLEAHVFDWNPASMRVLEKAGFHREQTLPQSALKDGIIVDQILYAYVQERRITRQCS